MCSWEFPLFSFFSSFRHSMWLTYKVVSEILKFNLVSSRVGWFIQERRKFLSFFFFSLFLFLFSPFFVVISPSQDDFIFFSSLIHSFTFVTRLVLLDDTKKHKTQSRPETMEKLTNFYHSNDETFLVENKFPLLKSRFFRVLRLWMWKWNIQTSTKREGFFCISRDVDDVLKSQKTKILTKLNIFIQSWIS